MFLKRWVDVGEDANKNVKNILRCSLRVLQPILIRKVNTISRPKEFTKKYKTLACF